MTKTLGEDLVAGMLGGVAAAALFVLLLFLTRRQMLIDSIRFGRSAVRAALAGSVADTGSAVGDRSGEERGG